MAPSSTVAQAVSLVQRANPLASGAPGAVGQGLSALEKVNAEAVGIDVGVYLVIGLGTIILFNFLRPNNKIVYAPKLKYAEDGKAPPKVGDGFFSWLPPLFKYKEADLLPIIGLDAVTFLRFLRLLRWLITVLAVLFSVVLMPVDIAYNLKNVDTEDRKGLNIITLVNVHGGSIWAHVAMSYIGTFIALGFIWYHYREMVRLRWAWFRSEEYQKSFHARTLMITNVAKRLQSDPALAAVLSEIQMPYPTTEVHIGRVVGALPDLVEKHSDLVRALERVLTRYLRDPNKLPEHRPSVRVGAKLGCIGGEKVDAIDYYTNQINKVEAAVESWRERIAEKKPESYGFASLAAVPYAHAAARSLRTKKPKGLIIQLAPAPRDIIWKNLTMTKAERGRSQFMGAIYLVALVIANIIPLLAVSLVANMAAFIQYLGFLGQWQSANSWSFSAVSGVAPPLISAAFGYFLPIAMRRIAKYRGVTTKSRLDRVIIGQYFVFLVISQFIIFSLIGVAYNTIGIIISDIQNHESFTEIINYLSTRTLTLIKTTYFNQSNYWLTWLPLRGYLAVFDLAQIIKLLWVWFQTKLFGRTPRDVREYTKPPSFDYAVYYSNLLFMAAVAMLYACLAPLVLIFAAVAFWLSSFVYKYQLMFVFTTKNESGGRLWRVVVNRLLVTVVFMQVLLALAVGLDQTWIQAIASIPPILFVIGFKIYLHKTFDERFQWYIPSEQEIAQSKVHVGDVRHNRLQRRFGHPTLHQQLFTPMVHAKVKHLLPQVYRGRLEHSNSEVLDGRKVETDAVAGGLKIAAIEEDQLEYDPHNDSDVRSLMSTTTMGAFTTAPGNGSRAGTPGSMTSPGSLAGAGTGGDYFKSQYANYLAHGRAAPDEEIELANVRSSKENLLEKAEPVSMYSDSADGTLIGSSSHMRKSSAEVYKQYTMHGTPMQTPPLEGYPPAQQVTYTDGAAGSYLPPLGHHANGSQNSLGSFGAAFYGQQPVQPRMPPRQGSQNSLNTQYQQYQQFGAQRPGAPARQDSYGSQGYGAPQYAQPQQQQGQPPLRQQGPHPSAYPPQHPGGTSQGSQGSQGYAYGYAPGQNYPPPGAQGYGQPPRQ